MKTETIAIVDHGRGPQLSTSRITVLDLVPYFQKGQSHDEIRRWLPTLSDEEITVVEDFYRQHQAEFDERDRRARERRAEEIRLQRLKFPESTESPEETKARLRAILEKQRRFMQYP